MVNDAARPTKDRSEGWRSHAGIAAITFVAFGALAQVTFEISGHGIPAFFPAAGLSLGVLMVLPTSRWPTALLAVAAAEFIGDVARGISPAMSLGLAAANVIEPAVAASLLLTVRERPWSPQSVQHAVAAMAASCVISGVVGASALAAGQVMPWPNAFASWWASDFVGQLVVAPAVVAFAPRLAPSRQHRGHPIEWVVATCGVGLLAFAGPQSDRPGPWLLILPVVLLAASRLGVRGVAWCGLILGTLSVAATLGATDGASALDALTLGPLTGLATLITVTLVSAHLVAAEALQRTRAEATLRVSEERSRALIDQSPVATVEVRIDDGVIESWNPAAERLFGWTAAEATGRPNPAVPEHDREMQLLLLGSLRDAHGFISIEGSRRSKEGELLHLLIGASPIKNRTGVVDRVVATFVDIGAHKQREQDLAERAWRDPLTQLANRAALLQHLEDAHERSAATGNGYCVLFCDLNGFKTVNDRYGHAVGDAVLVEVAQRLCRATRQGDVVARIGGDEFVVVVEHLDTERTPSQLGDRITTAIGRPIRIDDHEIMMGISVGSAWSLEFQDPEALLAAADASMYESKRHTQAVPRLN